MRYNANGQVDFVQVPNRPLFPHTDVVTQDDNSYEVHSVFCECTLTASDGTQINALKFLSSRLNPPAPFVEAQVIPRQNCLGYAFLLDYFIDMGQAAALLAGEGYQEVTARPAGDHLVLYYNSSKTPIHIGRYHSNEGLYFHKGGINALFVDDAPQGQYVMRYYPEIATVAFYQKVFG